MKRRIDKSHGKSRGRKKEKKDKVKETEDKKQE